MSIPSLLRTLFACGVCLVAFNGIGVSISMRVGDDDESILSSRLHSLAWRRSTPSEPATTRLQTSNAIRRSSLVEANDPSSTNSSTANPNDRQPYKRILFVHVGKAGGETIKSVLNIGCRVMRNKKRQSTCLSGLPPSRLSDSVTGYIHCFSKLPKHTDSYLFNVRHPVDRAISWYRYVTPFHCTKEYRSGPNCQAMHQLNNEPDGFVATFFQTCFPTVEDWALAVVGKRESNQTLASPECQLLAKETLAGKMDYHIVPIAAHMIANYQHYVSRSIGSLPTSKNVLVVRMDDMWDDMKGIDRYLGGTGDFGQKEGSRFSHGSEKYTTVSKHVSSSSAAILCCELLRELELYRGLINAAANLDQEKKDQTIDSSVTRCGFHSWQGLVKACGIDDQIWGS